MHVTAEELQNLITDISNNWLLYLHFLWLLPYLYAYIKLKYTASIQDDSIKAI